MSHPHVSDAAVVHEEIQRETMDVDVLIVGGGAAGMSAALHLQNSILAHNEAIAAGTKTGAPIADQMIVILEKASEIGAHSLSGAVLNPIALRELVPNYEELGCPLESPVKHDAVYYLGETSSVKFPITPPPFDNQGNFIISVSKFNRWLGQQCEAKVRPVDRPVECGRLAAILDGVELERGIHFFAARLRSRCAR